MIKNVVVGLITLFIIFGITGCGSSDTEPQTQTNQTPTLTIVQEYEINELSTEAIPFNVSDPDGQIVSVVWNQVSGETLQATITNNNTLNITTPSVTREGAVATIELTATDNTQASVSATIRLNIVNVNQPPIARAGDDISARIEILNLSGSDSFDPDETQLTYEWTLLAPNESMVDVDNANSVIPQFTPDVAGDYIFTLTVTDEDGASHSDEVIVNVGNRNMPPVADAGDNQSVQTGTNVRVNAFNSYDPERSPLTYTWRLITPENSAAQMDTTSGDEITFFADVDGEYRVFLIVNDGFQDSIEHMIIVEATTLNSAPVSIAGPDLAAYIGADTVIDGSNSYDPNNDQLSYRWFLVSQPQIGDLVITDEITSSLRFTPTLLGQYVFSLEVSDGQASSVDSVVINVTEPYIYMNIVDNDFARYAWPFSGSGSIGTQSIDEEPLALFNNAALVAIGADFTVRLTIINRNGIVSGYCENFDDITVIPAGAVVPPKCYINKATGGPFDIEFIFEVVGYEDHTWSYRITGEFL